MYSKTKSTYASLFLVLLLFSPLLVSGRGVRRRNKQNRTDIKTGKDPCRKVTCESPCAANPCSSNEICAEDFIAGDCCPVAVCTALKLTSQCSDPCENYTCPHTFQTCRAVAFDGEPCLQAFCSDGTANEFPVCEGVVCQDECQEPCPVSPDPYCGYDECEYNLPKTECCPTGSCPHWCY